MPIVNIESLDDFADKLGVPKRMVTHCIFHAERHYRQFRIGKRSSNGYRVIRAPSRQLKGLQRWILAFILRKIPLDEASRAFRPGCSILKNAVEHAGKHFVFSADIEDFYPSISIKRVLGLFRSLGYPKAVAFGLARLTTCHDSLPQGAPTSPDIANLVCRKMDARFRGMCVKRGWSYTRYADDITISGKGGLSQGVGECIAEIVQQEGFKLNKHKTHLQRQNSRQMVTGLVVNHHPNISRQKRRTWRAIFHQAKISPGAFRTRVAELSGYVGYLSMVSPSASEIGRYRKVLQDIVVAQP